MNILITGYDIEKIGKKIIAKALRKGHVVTALVANPKKVNLFDDNLRVIKGSCCSPIDLNRVLADKDVVINIITKKYKPIFSNSSKKIAKSIDTIIPMTKGHGIRRLLVLDTTTRNRRKLNKRQHISSIKNSALDWTIIRPARLVEKTKTNQSRFGENISIGLFSKVSNCNTAEFVLENINNESLYGKIISIKN